MHMKRIIFVIALLTLSNLGTNAVIFQKVLLKNGSVLNGFVQQQDGNGNMIVNTDNAIICVKNLNVSVSDGKNVNLSNLSEQWKDWADKNDVFSYNGSDKVLKLRDIKVGLGKLDSIVEKNMIGFEAKMQKETKSFPGVFLLESGSNIRFLEMTPNIYKISWDDVVTITSERRPKSALSGVDRKYVLKSNREISGQYAGETPTTISVYQPNGVVETMDFDNISKFTFYGINPQQDIFEQSVLLDVVKTKSEGDLKGVIIEQNYSGEKDSENYVSIWVKGRSPQMIKVSDINAICKEVNKDYNPKYDIILKEGQVVVNRKDVEFVGVKETGEFLVLDSLKQKQVLEKGKDDKTKLVLELRQKDTGVTEDFQLVKVKKSVVKKIETYGFSYKDLVNTNLRPVSVETSVNRTTRMEFSIQDTGIYALYDAKGKRAIPIIIK